MITQDYKYRMQPVGCRDARRRRSLLRYPATTRLPPRAHCEFEFEVCLRGQRLQCDGGQDVDVLLRFAERIIETTFIMKRLLVVVVFAVPLLAQPPPDFRVDVNLVRVPCIVMQANGAPVQGLRRDEFVVLEDGVPQEVKYLWQELDLPLTVVLLAETCSQHEFMKQYTRIMLQFLERLLSRNDHAAIVSVAGQAWLVTDLTDSLENLRSGAENIGRAGPVLGYPCSGLHPTFWSAPGFPCGVAPLWNAVFFSARPGLRPQTGRKAMLLLSDGLDTGSGHGLNDAIAACQNANAMVYSIRFLSPILARTGSMPEAYAHWVDRGKPDLDRIARETGGVAFEGKSDKLPEVFDRIEADLRNQYVLGYTPSTARGRRSYRKITVKVTRPGLTVRAQERDYAQ